MMIIRDAVWIDAPIEIVWEVFSEIEHWGDWNPVCRECRFEAGEAITEGACISFELNPMLLPMRIAPVVTDCNPGRSVTWSGEKWGIRAEHTFNFEPADSQVRLESIETFTGLMLWPARLIGVPKRLHILTRQLLFAIKTASENRYQAITEEETDEHRG